MSKIPDPQLPPPRAARPPRNAFAQAATAANMSIPANELQQGAPQNNQAAETKPPTQQSAPSPDAALSNSKERTKRMEGTRDILLSMPISQKERMEATIAHTQAFTGIKHQQVFIRTAVQKLCEQLEGEYNRSERYPMPPSNPHL